jgi:predicted ester cyclase
MSTPVITSLDRFHAARSAQRADELVRAYFDAVNLDDTARIDDLLARSFLSYDMHDTRSRTAAKSYHADLRRSFSDVRFEMHENIGMLVEADLVALRTIITGTHTGDYAGVGATGNAIQTSASHVFRVRDDQIVEHWPVLDSYRVLVAIGAIPGVASVFQQIVGVAESLHGLFQERLGTEFGTGGGRPISRDESRAVSRRVYDGVISTGRAKDIDAVAETYIQNTGWTPDGRSVLGSAWAIGRGAMSDGRAVRAHVEAENDRVA